MTSFYHSTTMEKLLNLRAYVSRGSDYSGGHTWVTLSMHDDKYNNQSITLSKQDIERTVLLLQAALREADEMPNGGTCALRMDITGDDPSTIETEPRPDYLDEVDDDDTVVSDTAH